MALNDFRFTLELPKSMSEKFTNTHCVSLCLSDDTLKAVGPFYLVSMPGVVKYPTQGVNV